MIIYLSLSRGNLDLSSLRFLVIRLLFFARPKTSLLTMFLSDLDRISWKTLERFDNHNEAFEQWYCSFNNVLEIHMPFKTRRVKIQHQPEWFFSYNKFCDQIA